MTRKQARRERDAFNAFCDGKEIQCRIMGGEWFDSPEWFAHASARIKPVPVPPGDLTREEAQAMFDKGEKVQVMYPKSDWGDLEGDTWADVVVPEGPMGWPEGTRAFRRKPATNMVPLGPEDVRPGDVVRPANYQVWRSVLAVWEKGFTVIQSNMVCLVEWKDAQDYGWEISKDGGATWQRCEKEAV